MRTLELHASLKEVKRSAGRSCVASSAYRNAERIRDERTGLMHDYRAKDGVEHSRIYLPDTAPEWARDRAKLWNACESKEKKINAMTAREWEIAFPYEFNIMQRREAGDKIAHELMRRYGCAVDIAYHEPNPEGDRRNYHAHIMFTTRAFDKENYDGWKRTKYRELSKDKVTVEGEKIVSRSHELKTMRAFIAREMNNIAERENMPIKTEYKSYESRGIDKIPTKKKGKEVTAMERKGVETRRAELNRRIKARNEQNFKTIMEIQRQGHKRDLKKLERKHSKGFFASVLSLFTGGKKREKAERTTLESSIERKADTIKAPKLEQQRQINRTANDRAVGTRDTINHRFKASQPHNTIEHHKGVESRTVKNVLDRNDELMEIYYKTHNINNKYNDKSKEKTRDHEREIGD